MSALSFPALHQADHRSSIWPMLHRYQNNSVLPVLLLGPPLLHSLRHGARCPSSRSCSDVNRVSLGHSTWLQEKFENLVFCHITEQAFSSFYRMTNIAKIFSDIFSELESPNRKANGWQVKAMQTARSARVCQLQLIAVCRFGNAVCCGESKSQQLEPDVRPKRHQNSYSVAPTI